MSIVKCEKCGEEYDSMYSNHECQEGEKQLGFGWGYCWIGLSVFNGFMATIGLVFLLIFLLPKIELSLMSIWMIILGFLGFLLLFGMFIGVPIAQTACLLQQKKWGLYLVYVELGFGALGGGISMVREGELFMLLIGLFIIGLWFNYFYERKAWFVLAKEEIPPPATGTFLSSWNIEDILTVTFLVLLLPIGLISMWTISQWPKKAKAIITIASLCPFVAFFILLGIFIF